MLSRRMLLQGACCAPLFGGLSGAATADMAIGSGLLTTVSDGHLTLPGSFAFQSMPPNELHPILDTYKISPKQLQPECNLALYRDGTNTVLFDVGAGANFMPSAGKITKSLQRIGIAPHDITHVLFTHAHPDHIWGLLDEFDSPLFDQAVFMMGRAEWDYWWNPETVTNIGEARAVFAVGARRRMEAIEGSVVLFQGDHEILPGIASVSTPGHTPGHMAFEIRQGNTAALVVGDAIANHHVAFHKPDWHSGSDQDPETAVATRHMLFDRLTTEALPLVGFHLPGGGIGRAESAAEGFRFIEV